MSFFDKLKDMAKDTVKTSLHTTKDITQSAVFKAAINPFIRKYGQILAFKIDSRNKAMLFEIMLKGEARPVRVNVKKYQFFNKEDKFFVKIVRVESNRFWIDAMMNTFIVDLEIELPKELNKPIQAIM
jgi:hypothetical protein